MTLNGRKREMSTKRTNKKMLAARILCTLLLGTYLTGGYGEPVAWGADNAAIHGEDVTIDPGATAASAWGVGAKASHNYSTAFGSYTKASGLNSTAFGDTTEARGENTTAWGLKAKAYGVNATSSGYNTVAGGDGATAFGGGAMALGFYSTAWGYYTQAGQLLYGSDKTVAYIVDYTEGGTTKYKIVDYNNPETTLKGGFSSYWEAYKECDVKDAVQATAWGAGTKALAGNATAFGNGSIASGIRSTAFGWFTEASGAGSTTWGIDSVASGNGATAWGGYTAGMNQVKGGTASGLASTAFGVGTLASSEGSTAWGYYTTAGDGTEESEYTTAWGFRSKATGYDATAWGDSTTASEEEATAWGYGTEASGRRSTAWGHTTKAKGDYATTWGSATTAKGKRATAWGWETTAEGETSTSWGESTLASGKKSTAWGSNTIASGHTSTAWGWKSVAEGKRSTAFGDSSEAHAENSLAALGGTVETAATNSAAIGKGAKVTVADAVALGGGSVASREAGATDAYLKTDSDTGNAWVSTHNAIAVGDDGTVTRQITGVAAGSKDTDAVNVAQLKKVAEGAVYTAGDSITIDNSTKTVSVKKDGIVESGNTGIVTGGTVYTALQNETRVTADGNYIKAANSAADNLTALDTQVKKNEDAIGTTADGTYVKSSDSVGENLNTLDTELAALAGGTGAGLSEVNHRIDNLDSKTNKVGAGAAALAALHPMDTDGKFGLALGYGNYRSANAMAMGLFYRPTDRVMFSIGGSMGNGENLMNVGVSFALDKGVTTSKAAMARKINALEEQNSAILEENKAIRAENAKLAERLAAIEAKLGK